MIQYLPNKKIDKKKWDECVAASPQPCLFNYSWYLDAVADHWDGLVMNDYEAVFPLAWTSKYGISLLYQPFFTRYFAVSGKGKPGKRMLDEFSAAVPASFRHVEIGMQEGQSFDDNGFQKKERRFQLLDLSFPYEKIYEGYTENARRNIKKAQKAALIVREGIAASEVVRLFKRTKGQELELMKPENYKALQRLMDACESRSKGESMAVYDDKEEILCAAFFMKDGGRITYLKSGLGERGKGLGAMHLLMDSLIRKYAGKPVVLDFGGSSVESVARFYKNFGGKDCLYLQMKRDHLPVIIKWARKIKQKRS